MKWKVSAHNSIRGLVDHLGPSLDMMSGGGHITDLTISLRGLGAFLPSRVECNATYVEVLI